MKLKSFLLIAVLFLAACAPDSPGGAGRPAPQEVVSQEQRSRAELLGEFYNEWKAELTKIPWAKQDAETLKLAEAFIMGEVSHRYLLEIREESLLQILEVFQVLPNGDPENAEMLKLAKATLKQSNT